MSTADIEASRNAESSASHDPGSQLALMTPRLPGAIVHATETPNRTWEIDMEPLSIFDLEDAVDDVSTDTLLIHDWQVEQLRRLGVPRSLAEAFAGRVDWHEIAVLVERGCAPELALEIVR
jgi:hypothetical protein